MSCSRPYRWILFYLVTGALCYGTLYSLFSAWDDSPRWARVQHPPLAQVGLPFVVSVYYRGLEPRTLLDVGLRLRDDQQHVLALQRPEETLPVLAGSGTRFFVFTVAADTHATTVQLVVQRRETPTDPNTPVHKCRSIGQALPTNEIPLIFDNECLQAWQNARSLRRILERAYREGHWKDKAGDPTVTGWLITLLYIVTGLLCLSNTGWRWRNTRPVPYAWFWWLAGLTVLFLGINKQLDLQMLLADVGRTYARTMGWYRTRKPVQIRVVALGASLSLGSLGMVLFHLRRAPRSTWCAAGGLILLVGFVTIHLVSLHQLEQLLRRSMAGLSLGTIMESGAILVVAYSAWMCKCRRNEGCVSSSSPIGH